MIVTKRCDMTRCPRGAKSPLVRTWVDSVNPNPILGSLSPSSWSLKASHSEKQILVIFAECSPLEGLKAPLEPKEPHASPTPNFAALLPHPCKPLHSVGPSPPWFGVETKTHFSHVNRSRDKNLPFHSFEDAQDQFLLWSQFKNIFITSRKISCLQCFRNWPCNMYKLSLDGDRES